MKIPHLKSGYALLDVKSGRAALSKAVKTHRVPVTIKGYIDYQYGADDGISIEFTVDVTSVRTGKAKRKPEQCS